MSKISGLTAGVCVLICVIGCGKFGGSTNTGNSGAANSANTAAAKAEKAVDVPSLIGKSVDEVKKILGPPTRELAGRLTWEFPQGDFAVETNYKDKKKVDYVQFSAKIFVINGQAAQGYATYDKLGDLIGFETRGKTPTSSDTGDTGSVVFEKVDLNGKNVDEIRFGKVSGHFIDVIVRPVRGY